jgi:hypothetical protein
MDYNKSSENNMKEEVRDIITKGVDMHKALYYGNNKDKANLEVDLLSNTFVNLRNAIKESCRSTMIAIDANRLAIYLFHNGNVSTHGVNFFKMTCICERIKHGSGIKEQYLSHTNLTINLFDDMIDELITNGRYTIINSDDILDSSKKIFISSKNITYSHAVSIFDNKNNILGFILVEMSHEYSRERSINEFEALNILASQLVPALTYSNYYDIAMNNAKPLD